jgi:hypothetical protein
VFGKTHLYTFLLVFNLSLFWYLAKHALNKISKNFKKNSRIILNLFVGPLHVFSIILFNIRPQTYTVRYESSIKYIPIFSLKLKKGLPHCKKKKNTKICFAFNSNFTYLIHWRQSKKYLYSLVPKLEILSVFTNVRVRNFRH